MIPNSITAVAERAWWVAPAVIAAFVAAVAGIITLVVQGRRSRTDRQRQLFAAAFGDIAAYCEFPFIVRRRRADDPAAERQRISTELSAVQQRLNQSQAVLRVEAPRVAEAYMQLVDATRHIAGSAISRGWDLEPLDADSGVHVRDVDLAPIKEFEWRFLLEASDHLALEPASLRRARREVASRLRRHPGDAVATRWGDCPAAIRASARSARATVRE